MIDAAGRRVGVKHGSSLVQGFLYGNALGPVAELKPDGTILSRFIYSTRKNVRTKFRKPGYRKFANSARHATTRSIISSRLASAKSCAHRSSRR